MLGRIELKQLVQGIPLASTVLSRSPLSWSEDNNIVVATQLGACIYEIYMSPSGDHAGLLVERVFLSTPDAPNPHIKSGHDLQKMLLSADREEAQAIMLDATLTTVHRATREHQLRRPDSVAWSGDDGNHCGFMKAIWSPRKTTEDERSLLCTVTYDHQIHLYGRVGVRWKRVCDIGELWYDFSKREGKLILSTYQSSVGKNEHHKFIAQTRFLAMADVTWTNVFENLSGEDFCLLIFITASSHVAILQIPKLKRTLPLTPSVWDCFTLDDAIGKVSAFGWFQLNQREGFLLIGTTKGDVEIHVLTLREEDIMKNLLYRFENSLHGMRINHLELICVHEEKSLYTFFLGKHNILIANLLRMSSSNIELLASTHSFIGSLAISGLKVIDPNLIYVSAQNGKLFKIEVDYDFKALSLVLLNKESVFASEGILYNGFCFSPNKSFLALLECVCVPYDHLIMKEPTLVSLFQVNTFDTTLQYLLKNESMNLYQNVDVFESLRLMMYQNEERKFPPLDVKKISSLSSAMKRVYLWITIIQLCSLPKDNSGVNREKQEELRNVLEEIILVDHITKVISSSCKKPLPKNTLHRTSLLLMFTFLQRMKSASSLLKSMKASFKKENIALKEACLICQKPVEFSSTRVGKCSNDHSMPRCFRSLLTTSPVLKCPHCEIFYHPACPDWFGDEGRRCLICARMLIHKLGRLISIQEKFPF